MIAELKLKKKKKKKKETVALLLSIQNKYIPPDTWGYKFNQHPAVADPLSNFSILQGR